MMVLAFLEGLRSLFISTDKFDYKLSCTLVYRAMRKLHC